MGKDAVSSTPSPKTFAKLIEYSNLLAQFGPNSAEAEEFHRANQHVPFVEHANDLRRLEQEDQHWRSHLSS